MLKEDRKIYGDCKFYVAEICGTVSLTYGARIYVRIYQHIDTRGKERVTFAYTQNRRSGGRENRLDTRLRKRSHVRHGQGRSEIMRMYSHAKRARKVQRGSNRRVSSPREEDRARNLDKADKDGKTTRRGEKGERKRKSRVCGRRSERGGNGGSGEEHEGERVCMQVLSEL